MLAENTLTAAYRSPNRRVANIEPQKTEAEASFHMLCQPH